MANTRSQAKNAPKKYKPVYTEQKARRLFKVYTSLLTIFGLIGWIEVIILQPLQKEEIEMKHMDPKEISAIPLPLQRVTVFVMFPATILLIYWLVKNPSTMMWNTLNLIKFTGVFYALCALSGNYLIQNWQHSLTASLYVATLLATTATEKRTSNILEELPFYDVSDLIATSRLYTTLLCTIPFQILTVLDHGMQIQRWPTPLLMGSTYGYIFGTLIGILVSYFANQRNEEKD